MENKMNRVLLAPLAIFALATLSPAAQADVVTYDAALASPGVYFGTGNSNSGFTVDTANNVEIGLSAIIRHQTAINSPGNLYEVPLGNYSGGGSAWGVDFSIDLQVPGGSTTLTLGQIDAVITVTDEGTGFSQTVTNFLGGLPDNTCYNGSVDATCTSPTDYAVQNSEPGSLFQALGDTNFNDQISDTYDISIAVYGCAAAGCTTDLLASDSIQVQAPEPNSLAIFGAGLLGLGYLWRRRGTIPGVAPEPC
jgi:hypothetical protein